MRNCGYLILVFVAQFVAGWVPVGLAAEPVKVGSKSFTESVLLGQMIVLLAKHDNLDTEFRELHGTRLAWSALLSGDIDLYPEYTGTVRQEILAGESLADDSVMRDRLAEFGIEMTAPLGFNNTYALGMTQAVSERLRVATISDLREHSDLRFGFSNEFMDRADGWPSLSSRYQLTPGQVRGLEHGLAYRALDAGDIDVTDLYSTDPNIRQYNLRVLEDDLGHFPRYNAVYLYRADLRQRSPLTVAQMESLAGRLDEARMQNLNERVELNHRSPPSVAAEYLAEELGIRVNVEEEGLADRLLRTTIEHLFLVSMALIASIAVAIPLGITASKYPFAGQIIIGAAEIIQTVPGLALLVFMGAAFWSIGWPMIGAPPVVVSLFLYSLLPIIRNTSAGLNSVPAGLKESARALGLPAMARLWMVELPLASRMILAGVKTTAVITVGFAALGGLIGAGGYGQPIMTGLRLNNVPLMLEGAIPAAVLALLVKAAFEWGERYLVPAGLRGK